MLPIERFFARADARPDDVALTGVAYDASTGELHCVHMRYDELRSAVNALAAAMQSLDPVPGSRVGICARNTTQHLIALLATYAAGKVWVPLSPRNGRAELDAMIAVTQPTLMVTDTDSVDRFTPIDVPTILARSDEPHQNGCSTPNAHTVDALLETFASASPQTIERSPLDPQIIKFSGGSTGTPKPVVQSVRCLNAQADGIRDFFEFNETDRNLIVAPLTHGASCFVLPVLERGGRLVLLANTAPPVVLQTMQSLDITTMYAPPTLLYALMASVSTPPSLPSLRHVIYSAAPMTPERIRECQRFFGPVIETAYGQVEAPQIITAMRAQELQDDANLSSVGRASSVATLGIMNTDGELLPSGEVGEIVVSGPLLMTGYLNRTDESDRTIVNGWLHTGDLGVLDDRGYLFIRGRLREVINSGGFKIFPGDVEAVLARHPAVIECAVFGVDDPKWGEAVHAAVVLHDSQSATADDLIAFAKTELGSVKAPKHIWFVSQLERNAAGKVSRTGVRAAVLKTNPPQPV